MGSYGELDGNGCDTLVSREGGTGMLWLVVIHADPGGSVTGSVIRYDLGTMGRTLFHFRTTPHDGRHGLDYVILDGALMEAEVPSLPGVCAFVRTARAEIEAERAPDLEALAPIHLGMALPMPSVEPYTGPGDGKFRLEFRRSDEDCG